MQVTLVPSEHVLSAWPDAKPHLEKAAEYTYGRYAVEDILSVLTDYDHSLWLAYDETGIKGATVTAFKFYPKKKYLDLVFCGGVDGFDWKAEMLRILQHWGYDNQCDGIEASGRVGWSKIFKGDGYKPLFQTFELPVADTGLGA